VKYLTSVLFILSLCFASFSELFAQERTFKPAVYVAPVSSQVRGDNLAGFDKFGFSFGAMVSYEFATDFSYEVGLSFIQKGSRNIADPANNLPDQYILNLNYIEVPVALKYDFSDKIFTYTGISLGTLISYKEEVNQVESNDQRGFSQFEFGYRAGIGYKLSDHIQFLGLFHGSANKIRVRDTPQGLDQRNILVSLAFRYFF